MCTDLGILLTIGCEYAWLSAKSFIQQYAVRSRDFVRNALRGSETNPNDPEAGYPLNQMNSQHTLRVRDPEEFGREESLLSGEDGHTRESFSLDPNP